MEISSDSFLNQPPEATSMRQRSAKSPTVVFHPEQAQAKKQKRPPSASAKGSKGPSSKQKQQQSSQANRDWQVREETVKKGQKGKSGNSQKTFSASSTQKMGATGASQKMKSSTGRRSSAQANNSRGRLGSKSRSKSRPREVSTDTADDIRKRVQMQFQNYMQDKQALDEEISLLEDSQATPPRDIKKQILEEQIAQRKRKDAAKKLHNQNDIKKKQDALEALDLRFKLEAATFRKELEAGHRSQERQEKMSNRSNKRIASDNSNYFSGQQLQTRASNHDDSGQVRDAYGTNTSAYKVGKQVSELRQWIEDAIKEEKMAASHTDSLQTDPSAQNLEIPGVGLGASAGKPPKNKTSAMKKATSMSKSKQSELAKTAPERADVSKTKQNITHNTSAYSNTSIDEFASKGSGQFKMLKHQLPGNSVLTETEQSKLGSRQDRYGVFGLSTQGASDFDIVVEEQRKKLLVANNSLTGQNKNKNEWKPSIQDAKMVKGVLNDALKSLGSRSDLKIADESLKGSAAASEVSSEFEDEDMGTDRSSPESEDSTDKVPVKQSPEQKAFRAMINQQVDTANDVALDAHILPGIVSTQAHFEKLDQAKKAKEAEAVQVIQKYYRGHQGRQLYKRSSAKDKQRIEFEYENLNRELKSDTQYNLKTYLAEKKRLRQKTGMVDSVEDEIAEVIGESSSVGNAQARRQQQSGAISMQLQNFFKKDSSKTAASGKDPLSLISIFAKRNGVVPEQAKARTVAGSHYAKAEKSSARGAIGGKQQHREREHRGGLKRHDNKHIVDTDSHISEEYSDYFTENSLPKEDSIKEDSIYEEEVAKQTGSGSQSNRLKNKRASGGKERSSGKDRTQMSNSFKRQSGKKLDDAESILTEVIDEESFGKDADSIIEDSIVNEMDSDNDLVNKSKKLSDSIAEDSIIKEEYDGDNFASYNASQSLQARNRVKFGLHSSAAQANKVMSEADKQKSKDQLMLAEDFENKRLERNRMIGSLMTEMKEYEKATMSEALVDRLEKIMVSSMAQKDQIIMAQRLSELEAEKCHKEEINKIREEQIKLMSQLMLLGSAAGGVPAHDSDISMRQREELLASIQKIIEKPIAIRNETVHVNYSVSKGADDQLLQSDKFGVSVSNARKSYLEEYDESKRLEKIGLNVVTQSAKSYADMVEEDIQLQLGKNTFETSQSRGLKTHQDSIDDLIGDATSAIEESIKDEVGESRISNSKMSKHSRDNSVIKQKQNSSADKKADQVLAEVEKAIDSERSDREEKLARDLKKRRISPRSYDRGIRDIEKWVVNEKKELFQRRKKLQENNKDIEKYIDKFRKDKTTVPMLTQIASPRPDSARRSYLDDSQNSEMLANAQRQAYLIEKELSGMSPEQKYTMKKREAAVNLIEQKEKAIQKALNEKMSKYQGGMAERLLQEALELDIEVEVEKRFEMARRDIEESRNLESARSIVSNGEKGGHTGRTKKSVQFAQSVNSRFTKPTTASTERTRANMGGLEEESITESIQIAESYSQSMRSQSAAEISKPKDSAVQKLKNTVQHSNDKFSPQRLASQSKTPDNGQQSDNESMIESDYSADFTEQSITSKDISHSNTASKAKLQAKAKDIEESGYSDNFDESESMVKSMTLKDDSATKDKLLKMDTVKEESVDDSAQSQSKDVTQSMGSSKATPGSKKQDGVESSMGSLPSEDISVKDSVRSVEWKFDVKQQDDPYAESAQEETTPQGINVNELSQSSEKKTSFIREEKIEEDDDSDEEDSPIDDDSHDSDNEDQDIDDSSSDLNTRDEMQDLESCPEGVGQSGSLSANDYDILAQADLITDELLELILNDYKDDDEFNLNATHEQPDEEDYKEKFPWTMDVKPKPKPSPKPEGVKMGAQPRPPKTQREEKDEEFKTRHDLSMKQIQDREEQVIEFMDFMCKRVDLRELMESLNKPIERDPMKVLSQIVNCYDEDDSIDKINDDTLMQAQQQILQQGFFNRMDREYVINRRMQLNRAAVEDSDQLTVSQEEMENINNVHHYALFESLNEALDVARPYQNKGAPMPWSKSTRVVKKIDTELQAKAVLEKARDQAIKWLRMRSGTNYAPLPEAPQPTQDEMGDEIIPPPLEEGEEERRNMHRQEKLAELMTDDIIENDSLWVDYEIQDTQTRFDVADMILHHLAGEIAEFLAEKAQ